MGLFARGALLALAVFVATQAVRAQDYPTRAVNVLVPFTPGGSTDLIARILAQNFEQRLGKPFVVENRPGAGTVVGATALAKSAPDGYTLMQATSGTFAHNPFIYRNLPYDPHEIIPVALSCSVPFVLVVPPSLPVTNVAELIKLAKERPLSYGSGGVGAFHHLTAELFSTTVGIKMTHVPYRGTLPALNDLIAGHIDVVFSDMGPALPLIRAGKLRALGVTTAQRTPAAPDIPPLAEVGVPGYDAAAWQMLAAPAKTPAAILQRINTTANEIVHTPAVEEQLVRLGLVAIGKGSLQELDAFVEREKVRWGKVVTAAGIAGTE
jgi:tripartite-type tricarboxylate transporter receptor subunit TctC